MTTVSFSVIIVNAESQLSAQFGKVSSGSTRNPTSIEFLATERMEGG